MEENGVTIVKSGTDFRNYTEIRVSLPADGGRAQIVCTKHDVTSEDWEAYLAFADHHLR